MTVNQVDKAVWNSVEDSVWETIGDARSSVQTKLQSYDFKSTI